MQALPFTDAVSSILRCTKRTLIKCLATSCSSESLQVPAQNCLDHFQQLIEATAGDLQRAREPRQMDNCAIFNVSIQIVIFKPQKSQ